MHFKRSLNKYIYMTTHMSQEEKQTMMLRYIFINYGITGGNVMLLEGLNSIRWYPDKSIKDN